MYNNMQYPTSIEGGNLYPVFSPLCGIHTCTVGTKQVITIPGLTPSGIVGLTFIHPPGGGAGQFFKTSTPTNNILTVELGQTATIAESIIWIVGKL